MTNDSSQKGNILLAAIFAGLALMLWFEPSIFFWNDDWFFIDHYFRPDRLSYILEDYNGHVKPLFKLLYFSELFVFGKNAVFFQMVSLIAFGFAAYVFYRIFMEVSGRNKALAAALAALLIAHPNCGQVALWIFETCIIMHILFQALTILFFFKYLKSDSSQHFGLFIICLIAQNYFFGNGIFFPMLFVATLLWERGFRINGKVIALLFIQVVFLVVQQVDTVKHVPLSQVIHDLGSVILGFFNLIAVSITRLFFMKQLGGMALKAFSVLVFAGICFAAWRNDKKYTLFGWAYLGVSAFAIPIARTKYALSDDFYFYYSVLLFPSLFFLIFLALSGMTERYYRSALLLFILVFSGYFILDIKVRRIFSYIHFKNKERMMDALTYGKPYYYPFDEASMLVGNYTYLLDNANHPALQRSIQKNSYYELDTAIRNNPGPFGATFEERSKKTLDAYKALSKKTLINFDINFEKK